MKTHVWPLIIVLILSFNISYAQKRGTFPIVFSGSNYSLAVNRNNWLAITNEGGKLMYGVCRKKFDKNVYSDRVKINKINYFNGDTALVTEAWMCVAGKGIAYTKDYGASWTNFAIPLINTNIHNHSSTIYFNNKRTGILSSQAGPENQLAYTRDNCKHWTIIPTPYGQRKYKSANDDSLKEINRVAIYRDYILVKQENHVFYSKADKIQWVPLRNYKDFYTDAENSVLFFEHKKGDFVKCDSRFKPVMAFDSIANYSCAISENGSLYVLGKNTLLQINRHNRLAQFPLFTNLSAEAAMPVKFGNMGIPIAHIGNNIYRLNDSGWEYLFTLPFATGNCNLSLKDNITMHCIFPGI